MTSNRDVSKRVSIQGQVLQRWRERLMNEIGDRTRNRKCVDSLGDVRIELASRMSLMFRLDMQDGTQIKMVVAEGEWSWVSASERC